MNHSQLTSELRRHQLCLTERMIAEVILDLSLGWDRPDVLIPQLKMFTSLTGISVPHVHGAIQGLHLKRIIRVVTVKGQPTYSIRTDVENWKVAPRASQEAISEALSLLRELNGLVSPRPENPTTETLPHLV